MGLVRRYRLVAAQLALIVALGAIACSDPHAGELALTILHTNDTHARIAEHDANGSTCSAEERREQGTCFGGIARRLTEVKRLRTAIPNVLLLDAGDQFQGTLFYSRFKGKAASRAMNLLGYDAMTLGNHEFDDGTEVLGRFVADLHFPVLVANLDTTDDPFLDGRLAPSAVVEIGGQRVGLVGCLTEETAILSRPGDTVDFLPIEESVRDAVAGLREKGIDKIILLSHSGYERDQRIAKQVAGLDVIVGGHTNTLLSNLRAEARGPYPTVVTGPEGTPVLVVQDFAWGMYLGRLDVAFDREGVATSWQGEPILLDDDVAADPAASELVAELEGELDAFRSQAVGETRVPLVGREEVCRIAECNLGDLIADALLAAHRSQGVEIALQNGGGIRASLPAGPITIGGVLEVLPFGNTASTFGLRGEDLLATLEHGVSEAESLDNDGTGRFLQVAGLRYTWSADSPPGQRIRSAEVREPDGTWRAIDPERVYRVVSNDFNRNGGDGFTTLLEKAIDPYDRGRLVADVVRDYLAAESPVAPTVDGRIRRVGPS